jgi:predicted short-subunit dehydrogenase-like oxidoreductase (DUF2520 family)
MVTLGFIGAGTVGTALAVRLSRKGYAITAVASRSRSSAQRLVEAVGSGTIYDNPQSVADNASLTFITTPDDAIRPSSIRPDGIRVYVVHCSGADSLDVLEPARIVGAKVVVPSLQTLRAFKSDRKLPGSTFALEAEGELLETLKELAITLEGHWIKLGAGDKAAYHTAAVMTSNYLVTLVKLATDLWDSFGIPREQAIQALLPLLKGTINNIENLGVPKGLTGPIARGDIGTVQIHLKTLQQTAPAILPVYCEMGLQTVTVALAKGKIDEHQAQELESILKQAKSYIERGVKCAQC